MTAPEPYEITLHLDDLRYLFQSPAPHPLRGRYAEDPGIYQIMNELEPRSLRRPIHTTIVLPPDVDGPGLEEATLAGIRRYCTTQIRWVENELRAGRRHGFWMLQIGLAFLALCLLLSALIDRVGFLSDFMRTFLVEGLIIVGWVSLWYPAEILLYEWWPHRRDILHYRHIRDRMTLSIVTEDRLSADETL